MDKHCLLLLWNFYKRHIKRSLSWNSAPGHKKLIWRPDTSWGTELLIFTAKTWAYCTLNICPVWSVCEETVDVFLPCATVCFESPHCLYLVICFPYRPANLHWWMMYIKNKLYHPWSDVIIKVNLIHCSDCTDIHTVEVSNKLLCCMADWTCGTINL